MRRFAVVRKAYFKSASPISVGICDCNPYPLLRLVQRILRHDSDVLVGSSILHRIRSPTCFISPKLMVTGNQGFDLGFCVRSEWFKVLVLGFCLYYRSHLMPISIKSLYHLDWSDRCAMNVPRVLYNTKPHDVLIRDEHVR